MNSKYADFDPAQGYPRGPDLFYECQQCHMMISSMSEENVSCKCFNLRLDADAGRLAVRDNLLIKLVRIESDRVK